MNKSFWNISNWASGIGHRIRFNRIAEILIEISLKLKLLKWHSIYGLWIYVYYYVTHMLGPDRYSRVCHVRSIWISSIAISNHKYWYLKKKFAGSPNNFYSSTLWYLISHRDIKLYGFFLLATLVDRGDRCAMEQSMFDKCQLSFGNGNTAHSKL